MKLFIVIDIGCIECGESTKVLGVYENQTDAMKAHGMTYKSYFAGGQHCLEIHEFDAPNVRMVEEENHG